MGKVRRKGWREGGREGRKEGRPLHSCLPFTAFIYIGGNEGEDGDRGFCWKRFSAKVWETSLPPSLPPSSELRTHPPSLPPSFSTYAVAMRR